MVNFCHSYLQMHSQLKLDFVGEVTVVADKLRDDLVDNLGVEGSYNWELVALVYKGQENLSPIILTRL